MRNIVTRLAIAIWIGAISSADSFAGEITFQFNYDSSFTTAAASNLSAAQADFNYIGSYVSSIVKTSGNFNVTMIVSVSGSNNPASNTLASAGSTFYGFAPTNTYTYAATQFLAQANINPGGAGAPVGQATVNFGHSYGFGGSVSGSQFDFRYILLHEMTHALGFVGFVNSNGTSGPGNGIYGDFDRYFYGWNGSSYQPLIAYSGSLLNPMANSAAAVVNSAYPVMFGGPNVMAYLGGAMQPMYTPSAFSNGSSLYHVNNSSDLMYYSVGYGPRSATYSGLDQAFLKDLGYNVQSTAVPELGTMLLTGLGLGGMALANRFRGRAK